MAAPHPGATQHCLSSLFPQPLAELPPQCLLHCFLGKFFTQISWGFFIFPFPQTCSCSSCSHVPGEQVASFPSGALPQWEAMVVSLPVPHPGHSTSSTLALPMALVTLLLCPPCFWVPVPISSCPTACSPFVPSSVPWAAGGCGCPSPVLACSIKPWPCSLPAVCCSWSSGDECGPSRVGAQEPEGGLSLSLGSPASPWGLRAPGVPWASLSSQHPLFPCLSFPAAGSTRGTLAAAADPRGKVGLFQVLEHSSWQGQHPQDVSPSSPHGAV